MTFGEQPRRVAVAQVLFWQAARRVILVRDATTWPVIFLELNADGSDVLSVTGINFTCSGMFRSVLKTA